MAPGGDYATIAGFVVDVRSGVTRNMQPLEIPWALTENRTLPVLGSADIGEDKFVEALGVDPAGRLWTVNNDRVRGPNRMEDFLAVECAPLAIVRPGFHAIAFDAEGTRIALLAAARLSVLRLADIEGAPLVEFTFPDSPSARDLREPREDQGSPDLARPSPSEEDIPF